MPYLEVTSWYLCICVCTVVSTYVSVLFYFELTGNLPFSPFTGKPRPNDVKNERERIAAADSRNLRPVLGSRQGGGKSRSDGRRTRAQRDDVPVLKPRPPRTHLPKLTVKVRRWTTQLGLAYMRRQPFYGRACLCVTSSVLLKSSGCFGQLKTSFCSTCVKSRQIMMTS